MNEAIYQALNAQANHEIYAASSYSMMSMWCKAHDFNGFSEFFEKQETEEMGHADRFFSHILDRGAMPRIEPCGAPKSDFGNLVELATHARELERANTGKIHDCYRLAQEVSDYAVYPMLLEMIGEQVEEESWADSMVSLCSRCECPGASYQLDRHIVQELEGGGGE